MSLQSLVSPHSRVMVRQKREWTEVLTSFEGGNRYVLQDEHNRTLGFIAEEGQGLGALITRSLLKSARAAVLHVYGEDRAEIARVVKPFRFWFWEVEVWDGPTLLGRVVRRFAWLGRRFEVLDAQGQRVAEVSGTLFNWREYKVKAAGRLIGAIRKKWGGLGRELFTDADSFGVEFEPELGAAHKALLLGATLLLDFAVFERTG